MNRYYKKKKKLFFVCIVLMGLGLGVGVLAWKFMPKSLASYAQAVVAACADSPYRPACYEKEIPKLMKHISMEDAFTVTKLVQDQDTQWMYCHTVAHALSFQESKKNPSEWKSVLLRCPLAQCNYGCLHGSLIERFRGEHLTDEQIEAGIDEIMDICEPRAGFQPTGIEKTMCYHGIGHLAMYMTDGRPQKALPICEQVAKRSDGSDFMKTCVEGVFMTVFQSVDPEDLALVIDIKPTKETVAAFCSQYGEYWAHCRRESFPLFHNDLLTSQGLKNFCAYAEGNTMEQDCYWAVMNIVTNVFFEKESNPVSKAQDYCDAFVSEQQSWCYRGVSMRLVQTDPLRYVSMADRICQLVQQEEYKQACYKDVMYYATFSFAKGAPEFSAYCQALSEPWRGQCLTQNY
jgi:hypothetical protein